MILSVRFGILYRFNIRVYPLKQKKEERLVFDKLLASSGYSIGYQDSIFRSCGKSIGSAIHFFLNCPN